MTLKSVSPDKPADSQTVQQIVDVLNGDVPERQLSRRQRAFYKKALLEEDAMRRAADAAGKTVAKAMDNYYKNLLSYKDWNQPYFYSQRSLQFTPEGKSTPMTNRTFYSILIVDKKTDVFDIQSAVAETEEEARMEAFRAFDPTGAKKIRDYDVVVLASKGLSARKTKDA